MGEDKCRVRKQPRVVRSSATTHIQTDSYRLQAIALMYVVVPCKPLRVMYWLKLQWNYYRWGSPWHDRRNLPKERLFWALEILEIRDLLFFKIFLNLFNVHTREYWFWGYYENHCLEEIDTYLLILCYSISYNDDKYSIFFGDVYLKSSMEDFALFGLWVFAWIVTSTHLNWFWSVPICMFFVSLTIQWKIHPTIYWQELMRHEERSPLLNHDWCLLLLLCQANLLFLLQLGGKGENFIKTRNVCLLAEESAVVVAQLELLGMHQRRLPACEPWWQGSNHARCFSSPLADFLLCVRASVDGTPSCELLLPGISVPSWWRGDPDAGGQRRDWDVPLLEE